MCLWKEPRKAACKAEESITWAFWAVIPLCRGPNQLLMSMHFTVKPRFICMWDCLREHLCVQVYVQGMCGWAHVRVSMRACVCVWVCVCVSVQAHVRMHTCPRTVRGLSFLSFSFIIAHAMSYYPQVVFDDHLINIFLCDPDSGLTVGSPLTLPLLWDIQFSTLRLTPKLTP